MYMLVKANMPCYYSPNEYFLVFTYFSRNVALLCHLFLSVFLPLFFCQIIIVVAFFCFLLFKHNYTTYYSMTFVFIYLFFLLFIVLFSAIFFSFPLLYFIFCPSLSLSHTLSLYHNVHLNSIYSPLLYLPFYFRQLRLLGEEQRALVHKHEHGRCRSSDIINKFMFEFELKSWRNAEKSRRGS